MTLSIAKVHWNHLLRYGLGQMAPGSLNLSLSNLDLNDGRLGGHSHCSGIFLEKL